MKPLSDTHPEIERMLINRYRQMSAQEKLERLSALNRAMVQLALADIRLQYPRASEHECRMRLFSRWLPPELMRTIYGWDPQEEGYSGG